MSVDKIADIVRADPFKPFLVVLRDGKRIPVNRPLRALLTSERLLLGVDEHPDTKLASRVMRVPINDVLEIELG